MNAIPLPVLIDALAALRAVKDSPGTTVPNHLWTPAMRAHNALEAAIAVAGIQFAVGAPKELQRAVAASNQDDGFNGDTPHLINSMRSLVSLNDAGALTPHGIGGHARALLLAGASRLERTCDTRESAT